MTQFSSLAGGRLDEELGTDDSTILFTTTRRQTAINRGVREFAELTECLQRWSTVVITGGTFEYDLNSTAVISDGDFLRLSQFPVEYHHVNASSQVMILAGPQDLPLRDVKWLDEHEPGWRNSTVASSVTQYPELYYVRLDGGHTYLGFWPPPSTGSSESAKTLVPYIAQPAIMSASTDVPYTAGGVVRVDLAPFHQAAVHWAAHQLEKLRRDDQASDRQLQKFLTYVQRFWANTRRKGGQRITFAKNYFRRQRSWQQDDPHVQ